jgi:hypothetical protein
MAQATPVSCVFVVIAIAIAMVGACSTSIPAEPLRQANAFEFTPRDDGTVKVDGLFYYPHLDLLGADRAFAVTFGDAATAYCGAQYQELPSDIWCHEAQRRDQPGTIMCVNRVIRCVETAS